MTQSKTDRISKSPKMKEGVIACPKCGNEFEISEALTGKIREHLQAELQRDLAQREANIAEQLKTIREQEEELIRNQGALDEQVQAKLKEQLQETEQSITKKVEDRYAYQLKDLQDTIEEREKIIKDFRQKELELRKRQRELEEAKENAELEIVRKIDEERVKIREEAEKKLLEDHRLKDLEKDKIINDLKTSLEDMKRRAEQGSMETQGEVLEQDFEAQLRSYFPHDDIQPVSKGIRGADLSQLVRTSFGIECGTLLWEMKNTKAWNAQWISKLKDDMIETRATVAILVSVILPKGIARFGLVDGVWVSDPLSAIPLAVALREHMIDLNRERTVSIGKNEKIEALYQYLAGEEFKQKIVGIVEAFSSMQKQLNQERRAMERQWRQREKQIERVTKNTVGLYGDMQGIIGGQIPSIPALELEVKDIKQLPEEGETVK